MRRVVLVVVGLAAATAAAAAPEDDLLVAVTRGDAATVRALIRAGADPTANVARTPATGLFTSLLNLVQGTSGRTSPASEAVQGALSGDRRRLEVLTALLQAAPGAASAPDPSGEVGLTRAADAVVGGNPHALVVVDALLAHGADPNAGPRPPLAIAARGAGADADALVTRLLTAGADPLGGLCAALSARRPQHVNSLVLALGDDAPARLGRPCGPGMPTPLRAAIEVGDAPAVTRLLQAGAPVDLPDDGGLPPLARALTQGTPAAAGVVVALVGHGADRAAPDALGRTAFDLAGLPVGPALLVHPLDGAELAAALRASAAPSPAVPLGALPIDPGWTPALVSAALSTFGEQGWRDLGAALTFEELAWAPRQLGVLVPAPSPTCPLRASASRADLRALLGDEARAAGPTTTRAFGPYTTTWSSARRDRATLSRVAPAPAACAALGPDLTGLSRAVVRLALGPPVELRPAADAWSLPTGDLFELRYDGGHVVGSAWRAGPTAARSAP